MSRHPIVVALTGASGAPYGLRLLQVLATHRVPVWLIPSSHGMRLLRDELLDRRAGRGRIPEERSAASGVQECLNLAAEASLISELPNRPADRIHVQGVGGNASLLEVGEARLRRQPVRGRVALAVSENAVEPRSEDVDEFRQVRVQLTIEIGGENELGGDRAAGEVDGVREDEEAGEMDVGEPPKGEDVVVLDVPLKRSPNDG